MTCVLIRDRRGENTGTKATGRWRPRLEGWYQMPGKGGSHERLEKVWMDSPQNLSRELGPTDMSTGHPASRDVREYIWVVVSHHIGVIRYGGPRKLIQWILWGSVPSCVKSQCWNRWLLKGLPTLIQWLWFAGWHPGRLQKKKKKKSWSHREVIREQESISFFSSSHFCIISHFTTLCLRKVKVRTKTSFKVKELNLIMMQDVHQ